jgi:hypothetical protein
MNNIETRHGLATPVVAYETDGQLTIVLMIEDE